MNPVFCDTIIARWKKAAGLSLVALTQARRVKAQADAEATAKADVEASTEISVKASPPVDPLARTRRRARPVASAKFVAFAKEACS
ncbi:MAG: hypothetical protein DI629_14305 [Mesorhizobium amorphae]|nr:MAG: hypothetical protein DI629_14305 [Mesorhizobium amorphae]